MRKLLLVTAAIAAMGIGAATSADAHGRGFGGFGGGFGGFGLGTALLFGGGVPFAYGGYPAYGYGGYGYSACGASPYGYGGYGAYGSTCGAAYGYGVPAYAPAIVEPFPFFGGFGGFGHGFHHHR